MHPLHRSLFLWPILLLGLTGRGRAAETVNAVKSERFGGSFECARLASDGKYWNRHASADPLLLEYLAKATTMKIDTEWRSVRAISVDELRRFPFVYSDTIAPLSARELENLSEYLRRGGFLFIDACGNRDINPDQMKFLAEQIKIVRAQFPDLRVEETGPSHPVYSVYFKMKDFPPHSKADKPVPLRTLFSGDRMIGMIGVNGFQCAFDGYTTPDHATACAQMVANIYVYAMTR